ncbi:MAG: hypothetical protein KH382_06865 [Clostridiales bacterium]|nr:hypothetical protein [Clostridiales bacterium]
MPKILDYIDALRLDNTVSTGIQFIMWPLIFGLILSFFIIYYRRRVIGAFVRAIREAGASDEESAKTLAEIGQEDNSSAISALKKSSSLRRLITICPGEEASGEELVINEKTRFYIGKEAETRSRVQYGDKEEPLWPVILGSAALILFGIVVFYILIRR